MASSLPRRRAARHVALHFLAHTSGLFGGTQGDSFIKTLTSESRAGS
jgi:hypothetical protein